MTRKQSMGNRIISIVLSIAILLAVFPPISIVSSAASIEAERVADPSTMDGWKEFFPITGEISTENAGGVWMDKSVLLDDSEFAGTGIKKNSQDSFLVALSAIASNMNVTGMSSVPTDTILVLDVSGSMNDNYGNNDVAEDLVNAANASVETLLNANPLNRVGIVLYSGPLYQNDPASDTDSVLMLPLGRYETGSNGSYLTYNVTGFGSTTESIGIDRNVKYEGTNTRPTAVSKNVVGATYIQKGIMTALDEFLDNGNVVNSSNNCKPVVVLMSDGAPSLGSTNFTNPGYNQSNGYNVGSGSGTSAALGFLSQLTASYAKEKIEEKYGTDALFYTLGLGLGYNDTIALSVMDPDNANASTAVDDFWNDIQYNWRGQITFAGYNRIDVGETVSLGNNRTVTKIETPLEQNYVDQYFPATTDNLVQVFESLVSTIQLKSGYYPTLVAGNEELSGYVSFVDRVGEYMSVTDIKGILIDNHLFSGADLASNFVEGGGKLGTYDNPSALGIEMVAAVRARLGIENDDIARTLIGLAYENGQLSYTDSDNYSNYIGWYANAAGKFLGFYNDGTTVLPEKSGNIDTDPAYVIRSYGYLGEVDESHGVSESDMMYATVQIRKNIATGEEIVTFAIPAALIPLVTYEVSLDENSELTGLNVSGADNPIRLVYEVALDKGINSFNLKEIVSSEYLSDPHNINADGSVNFYTNQWEHQNTTGYGTINTYSYFNPSRQNDQFYYTENTAIYTDENGTLYTEDARPDAKAMYYRTHTVYKNNGSLRTETVYHAIHSEQLETAVQNIDGSWYIPKGNVRTNWSDYVGLKEKNATGTLSASHIPFIDITNHEVNEEGYDFYVGATLGNNGKLTVAQETGLKLTKAMAQGAKTPNGPFTFIINNESNLQDNNTYEGLLVQANGEEKQVTVQFTNGSATISCAAGETFYIGGMVAGHVFSITEMETAEYVATATGLSRDGTVTIEQNEIKSVLFINDDRGTGNLTIAKEVEHDFGQNYNIPSDKTFTMKVTLSGIGTANANFVAEHSGNNEIASIQTNDEGVFYITLKHDEQFEVFDLPANTEVTVVEQEIANGFTPVYWDNGIIGDGRVTVIDSNTVSVIVVNDYTPAEVYPVDITIGGRKLLENQNWQQGYEFDFVLQKLASDGGWVDMGTAKATYGATTFSFDDAFANERYAYAGTYYYRIIEIEPNTPLGGFSYDKTVHSFSVNVGDNDMDGKLEITDVVASRPDTTEVTTTVNGWNIDVTFINRYSTTGNATVTIDLNKVIENVGGSDKSLAGYTFGLYDGENIMFTSPITTDRGFARFVLDYTETGVYKYTLKEIVPNEVPAGWVYSTLEIPVTVVVSDDGDGTISAIIYTGDSKPEAVTTSIEATFVNTYDPKDATLDIDFVSKQLSGRAFTENDNFTFSITETNVIQGQIPQTLNGVIGEDTDNDGIVDVIFDGSLTFDKVGTYFFEVREISDDGNGITTDKTTYRITVNVNDVDGQLVASYVLVNATGNEITFKNTYVAEPVEHSIIGTKSLEGRTLINDEFSFMLTEVSYDGTPVQNPQTWAVKNFISETDNVVFPTLTYYAAGTYVYSVKEIIPENAIAYGISFDSREYTVTVIIGDDGEGRLFVKSEIIGGAGDILLFENKYKANPTTAQFLGDKKLTGKVDNNLVGGEYEFELYNADANWGIGSLKETVTNAAGGVITFTEIDFEVAGNQYFIVIEVNSGQKIDGVLYDDAQFRVLVNVTDDLKGQLHATVHIYDEEGIPQDRITFVNVYEVTGDASVVLSGEKFIDGREFRENDSFTFEIYDADENYSIIDDVNMTAQMDSETHRYEFNLSYTAEDIGKTYYYIIKEANAEETINGVTYSDATHKIKVEVKDNGIGGIETVTTILNATFSTLNFTNEYKATADSISIEGTKQLAGRDLNEGEFRFVMVASDNNFNIAEDSVPMNALNRADGTFSFDEISFAEQGTYYFVVYEDDTVDAERVTFDNTIYHITVEVIDDGNGNLVAGEPVIEMEGSEDEVGAIVFNNIYTPEIPDEPDTPDEPEIPDEPDTPDEPEIPDEPDTPDEPEIPENPTTGDENSIKMWIALMFAVGSAAVTLYVVDKKKRKQT